MEESKSWDVKKENDLTCVRTKCGSDFNKSLPVLNAYNVFPDCEDPELILKCLNEYRKEWDQSLDAYDELTDYTNKNTIIYRIVLKPVVRTSPREFLDKKIWFRESDTLDEG